MSTLVLENVENSTADAAAQNADVARTPFYLTSCNEPLMAWLHTAKQRSLVDHAVVICPPIGFEQLHSHRALRHLADAISFRGIPTLRFDWHGTGDSAGSDADPSRFATWRANVRDVIDWLRSSFGCGRISVVGLRLGALLAVEAIEPGECDNLVLWAPVTVGKTYLRQLQAIERMAESCLRPEDAAAGDVEAAGFLISEETAGHLATANLLHMPLHCRHALVVGPADDRLIERFTEFAIPVEQISPPGYVEMMAEPHLSRVPHRCIGEITDWLGQRIDTSAAKELVRASNELGPQQSRIAWTVPSAAVPTPGTLRERIHRIGEVNLFSVLSEPETPTDAWPTIVILNAGSANHVGPGRLHVELARHLASVGFRCLRLDARGLGESIVPKLPEENNAYPATVFRDVELTLDELRTQFGEQKCVLMGLCSGAYAAFQSAVQLKDPLLVESVLINPLTFYWHDVMSLEAADLEQLIKEQRYLTRARNLKKVWKFLRGKTAVGYRDALRLIQRRLMLYLKKSRPRPTQVGEVSSVSPSHPLENNLPADLARVALARRQLAMFLAENDPGYAMMAYHAPRETKQWLRSGSLHLATIDGGDHTFSRRLPRRQLLDAISAYLRHRYT